MKKLIALLLVLVLAFSLAACGAAEDTAKKTEDTAAGETAAPAEEAAPAAETKKDDIVIDTNEDEKVAGKPYPNCNEDGSMNLDKICNYDREYDYSQNEKFKIRYLASESSPLYQEFSDCLELWAPKFNYEYAGFFSCEGDSDLYMTTLQNDIDQGVKVFILDPDSTMFGVIETFLKDYPDVVWCGRMSGPRDNTEGEGIPAGGNMIGYYVGFDHYDAGYQQSLKLLEWKQETLPDVAWEDIGILTFDFSTSSQLHARVGGTYDAFIEHGAEQGLTEDNINWFVADCVSGGLNIQSSIDASSPVLSTNDYTYWLVAGNIDDFAQGAASVIEGLGLTDTSCVVAFGGAGLLRQFDAGQQDAFRYALYTANSLYCEPVVGSMYAQYMGWAKGEELWPSWVNQNDCGGEGHTWASPRLPTEWLAYDTYQHYLAWCDLYTGFNIYGYSQEGVNIDDFSPFVDEVPAEYALKQ